MSSIYSKLKLKHNKKQNEGMGGKAAGAKAKKKKNKKPIKRSEFAKRLAEGRYDAK